MLSNEFIVSNSKFTDTDKTLGFLVILILYCKIHASPRVSLFKTTCQNNEHILCSKGEKEHIDICRLGQYP